MRRTPRSRPTILSQSCALNCTFRWRSTSPEQQLPHAPLVARVLQRRRPVNPRIPEERLAGSITLLIEGGSRRGLLPCRRPPRTGVHLSKLRHHIGQNAVRRGPKCLRRRNFFARASAAPVGSASSPIPSSANLAPDPSSPSPRAAPTTAEPTSFCSYSFL